MRVSYFSALLLMSVPTQVLHARFEEARMGPRDERKLAYNTRRQAAYTQTLNRPYTNMNDENNGDEVTVPNFAGNFNKCLEHDPVTGNLTDNGKSNYLQLVKACTNSKQVDWNAIQRTPGAIRLFVNPQAGCALTMNGEDSSLFVMELPPKLVSAEAAADMIETYLNSVCRDVKFHEYGTGVGSDVDPVYGGSLTAHAAAILDDLGDAFKGPRDTNGAVTPRVLFRGKTAGDLVGPYVSQFFLVPLYPLFNAGCVGPSAAWTGVNNLPIQAFETKQTLPIAGQREFGVAWNDFIALQNGFIPKKYTSSDYSTNKRYAITGRDFGSYVHRDGPYEPYYNALNILASRGFPISPIFPYAQGLMPNEGAGLTMGAPDAFGLLGTAALAAFRAAWAQKWRCHRRLRPEAFAGLIHRAKVTDSNPYNLHESLFELHNGYDYLALVKAHNELQATLPVNSTPLPQSSTYLLSQMYPEASPEHTSYPSGHATGAGACVTILKALFNENEKINAHFAPVKVDPADPAQLIPLSNAEGADQLTVGGELNKLAFTISMGRDFGGVHYRSDGWNGMLLGEQLAITVLQDHARIYQEEGFVGFELTKFDGHKIRITPDEVIVLS